MDLLSPKVKPYPWGTRDAIADLQGRPVPAPGPEAELWMGAHPSGPSGLERDGTPTTLDRVIAADPERELGPASVARFGSRLPFLLKVIAAEKALSIQAHPDRHQALLGFQAENERGIPLGDPARTYVDDWPKPELVCAVTSFEALAGLRPGAEAADLLASLGIPELDGYVDLLRAGDHAGALRRILTGSEREPLLDKVVEACARVTGRYAGAARAAVRLAGEHPGDPGILASLLLRHVTLQPGEALFMPAGGLHAYLHGIAVEVLANSDNVLRAGLTPKHIDVPELLRILDPHARIPLLEPVPVTDGVSTWDSGAAEFRLYRLDLADRGVALPGAGPRIVLCLDGELLLRNDSGSWLKLGRGGSCFVPAADGGVTAEGTATAVVAGTGDS